MRRFLQVVLWTSAVLSIPALHAQKVDGSGWSSFGVLPFRGYDYIIIQAPKQYVLYFKKHTPGTAEGPTNNPLTRAFSTDLKNFTLDPKDACASGIDLCAGVSLSGALTLPDGRIRLFFRAGSFESAISSDGITWTQESGTRMVPDPNSIYERGPYVLAFTSFVYLPDGSVRMYYEGGIAKGTSGTPAYYNSIFDNGVILSAVSKDGGLTWVRDPGVRVNPLVQGPVGTFQGQNQFDGTDVTAVAVQENGRTVYRLYCPSLGDGTVSYVSNDGLSFALEGQIPADRGDAKAIVMKDGRVWVITNGPDAVNDTLVYGPQQLFVRNVKANTSISPVTHFPAFQSATLGVTGSSSGPVVLTAGAGTTVTCTTPQCVFHPEYYTFSPSSGTAPFNTVMTYTGPADYADIGVYVHAKGAEDTVAAGGVFCMGQLLGTPGVDAFCRTVTPELPMTRMNFGFSSGAAAASQTSNILSLGGQGYPFTVSSSVPWAVVSPASGIAPTALTVTVDPTGLAAGSYTGVITVSAEGTTEQIAVSAVVSAGPVITSVQNSGSGVSMIAPNSFLTIYGSGFSGTAATWNPVTNLPTNTGGVSVKIDGRDAYVSYASSTQLNVLAPPGVTAGSVPVVVTAASGSATSTVAGAAVSPAWFTYTTGGPAWIAALFANTATYVAPAGIFGAGRSQAAKAGDYLQLYANGLGTTNPAAPSGVVLTTAYPLDDLSRVKVTIGGYEVPVLFAGLVSAGLYQINVQVPAGIGTGELPVQMFVDGRPTQEGVTLNFR